MDADIQRNSCCQSMAIVSYFDVAKQLVYLAVPLCNLAYVAGKLVPPMLAYRVVLAFTLVG